jgi:hypothetical protein
VNLWPNFCTSHRAGHGLLSFGRYGQLAAEFSVAMRSASRCRMLVAFVIATAGMALAADTNTTNKEITPLPLTGTFVTSALGQRPPLYTIQLNRNGTYELLCSVRRYGTDINGDPDKIYTYPGLDSGTWRWAPEKNECFLASTNCRTDFPLRILCYHEGDTNRLEAVNALLLHDPWLVRKKDP